MTKELINITEGSITRQIFRLAWPAVGAMFLRTANSIADAMWVGRLGASEMASVISSMFVLWILFSVFEIVWTGAVAVISRFYGARQTDKVAHAARQAVLLAVVGSIAVGVGGFFGSGTTFDIMETAADVKGFGTVYLQIAFAATFFIVVDELLASIFRATGDTRTPLIISSIGIILNICLDPVLIFGWGPFPAMGVAGAAIATVVSYIVGFFLYLFAIRRGKLTFDFNFTKKLRPDFTMLLQMVRIGLPLATAGVVFSVVYMFMNRITTSFGTEAVAALGIGNRLESVSFLICFGFSLAVSTLVGQNLGARKPDRAAKSTWYTLGYAASFTAIISVIFATIPRLISRAFIDDPAVADIAVDYLMILAISQTFMAAEIVLEGAFSGAGDTMPAMIVSIAGSIARYPLAYYIAFNLDVGVNGVWWAITLTTVVKGMILMYWFSRGKWKLKEVHG